MDQEFLLGLMDGMPQEVAQAILDQHGRELALWQEKYEQSCFDARLKEVISNAGGRNAKAICALLEQEQLRQADDEALQLAVEQVKKECGYLFGAQVPPYAAGTGAQQRQGSKVQSLAQALREKFGS